VNVATLPEVVSRIFVAVQSLSWNEPSENMTAARLMGGAINPRMSANIEQRKGDMRDSRAINEWHHTSKSADRKSPPNVRVSVFDAGCARIGWGRDGWPGLDAACGREGLRGAAK